MHRPPIPPMEAPTPNAPLPSPPRPKSTRPPVGRWAVVGAVLVVMALAVPAFAAASPPGPAAPTLRGSIAATSQGPPPATGGSCGPSGDAPDGAPCGTWAWGAAANLTAGLEYEGSYNASQFLTGGSLTTQGAYIDLEASLSAEWAAYAIVNATSPSPGQLYVTFQAGDMIDIDLSAVAQGDFPLAGTYGPDSNVTLQAMNVSLVAHEKLTDRYQAYLNLSSSANGSLALENENLEFVRTVSVALTAVNFPNVTVDPQGNAVVSYTTGQVTGTAQVVADLSATFTPALVLVQGPVHLGETWTSSSEADFTGSVAYTVQLSGIAPGGNPFSYSNSGSASANADVPLDLTFTVVGERTIFFPNGGSETDYVIEGQDESGATGISIYDGLVVLPASTASDTGTAATEVAEHPASQELSSSASTPSRPLYSTERRMADDSDATPVSGQTVTAAPMSPQRAQALLNSLGGLSPLGVTANSPLAGELIVGSIVLVVGLVSFREIRRRRRNRAW